MSLSPYLLEEIGICWVDFLLSAFKHVKNQWDKGPFWHVENPIQISHSCIWFIQYLSMLSYIISPSLPYCKEIMNFLKAEDTFPTVHCHEPCRCSVNINWINQLPQHRCTRLSALCFHPATNITCAFSCPCRSIGPTPPPSRIPAQAFCSCVLSRPL